MNVSKEHAATIFKVKDDKLERIWKKATLALFKLLYCCLLGTTEENRDNSQSG